MASNENTINNKQEHKLYSEPFIDSFIQALLIDVSVYGLLGVNPLLGLAGATVGYSLRKYCGEYMGQDHSYKPFVCGALGGAFKYGIIGQTYALPKLALGAYNNIAYEYWGSKIDSLSKSGQSWAYAGVEGGEGILQTILDAISLDNEAFNTKNPHGIDTIIGGSTAGTLIFLSIDWLYEPLASTMKSDLIPYAATMEHFVADYFLNPELLTHTNTTSDKWEL